MSKLVVSCCCDICDSMLDCLFDGEWQLCSKNTQLHRENAHLFEYDCSDIDEVINYLEYLLIWREGHRRKGKDDYKMLQLAVLILNERKFALVAETENKLDKFSKVL